MHHGRIAYGPRMTSLRSPACAALLLSIAAASGCGGDASTSRSTAAPASAAIPPPPDPRSTATDTRPRVVFLGDSLTAGLGLSPDEAYPALIQQRIDAVGLEYRVVNAGVSGDTSFDALSRLDWALEGDVRVLVVALGGNDGLRGLPADQLQQNLAAVIERAQARAVRVILAGMEAPPNFGESYTVAFHKVYPALAKKYGVPLVPFLLQGVAGIDGLNQRDGIHPTAEGARTVADNVWTVLRQTLKGT
jgi:acyl-CoA thioesterase I